MYRNLLNSRGQEEKQNYALTSELLCDENFTIVKQFLI